MNTTDMPLDTATRSQIIDTLLGKLRTHYVFPQVAENMEEAIRLRQENGEYDAMNDGNTFAREVTRHLREISKDKHLGLYYREEVIPLSKETEKDDHTWSDIGSAYNYGFYKVERLAGNIGYLDFRAFYPTEVAGEVGIAAMNFLAGTHAMIVDLRQNHGGDPSMIALLCSYFFPSESVHLNSLYWRASDTVQQFWTLPYVPGKRYGNKPVYVLTSHETFSGAEEFTYNLKNLKRAMSIGEVTGGGAHPGDIHRIHAHFEAFIPDGRAINPISGSNWEGIGVTPDIEVPREDALKLAHIMALKKVLESVEGTSGVAAKVLIEEIRKTLADLEQ